MKCFLLTFLTKNNQTRSCNSHSAALYSGQHPEYFVNNSPISACTSHKDLDIILLMTSNLSWSEHVALITSKAYKKLGLLRRTFCSRNTSCAKRSLYLSLVRSNLLFGSQVWRPSLLKDIKALENIQRHATKFILNDYSSSSTPSPSYIIYDDFRTQRYQFLHQVSQTAMQIFQHNVIHIFQQEYH